MKRYNLSQEQLKTLFDLFDSGMKTKAVAEKTGIEYDAVNSARENQYLAKKQGFNSFTEYQEHLAKKQGFNSLAEYYEHLAKQRINPETEKPF